MLHRLLVFALVVAVVACSPAERLTLSQSSETLVLSEAGKVRFDDWMHTPLRPDNHAPLSFTVEANSDVGIAKAELYIYEYELYRNSDGLQSQRQRLGGLWGKARSWDLEAPLQRVTLEHTHGLGFGAHTRIEYIWRLHDAAGAYSDRLARFDAGTSPWPTDKVLLYSASRRPMADMIDIGFFRDTDYKGDKVAYAADVEAMIKQGFFAEDVFSDNRTYWAFYTTDRETDGQAIANDITNDLHLPSWLKDFSIPGIDAFCLLHKEDYTDRSLLLENFHSLSNNLFSAEAHNWGTAVHECGHAIFHLSDEYGGCACFQTHNSSNVFREQSDCAKWNMANGFPADDCYELRDLYDRSWFSAEEPTFFASEAACQEHNRKLGMSIDSCRNFINAKGEELFWAFESTCIMHDDGDHLVRPFQRACRRVITDFYGRLSEEDHNLAFAKTSFDNIYGYEPVVVMEMTRQDQLWSLRVAEAELGIPTNASGAGGEVVMRVFDENGKTLANYNLAQPGAVHVHGSDGDSFQTPQYGTVRVAVPASKAIARVVCEFNNEVHARGAAATSLPYRDPFVFEVAEQVQAAIDAAH